LKEFVKLNIDEEEMGKYRKKRKIVNLTLKSMN